MLSMLSLPGKLPLERPAETSHYTNGPYACMTHGDRQHQSGTLHAWGRLGTIKCSNPDMTSVPHLWMPSPSQNHFKREIYPERDPLHETSRVQPSTAVAVFIVSDVAVFIACRNCRVASSRY